MTACLATIGGFDTRLRLGGLVAITETENDSAHGLQQTGVICKINPSGRIYVQDDFGVIKKCPITSLSPIEEIQFNVSTMWEYDMTKTTEMWIELLSFSVYKINVKKWIFGASSFCHSVNLKLLKVQQQLLLMLKATRRLFSDQNLLRNVLKGTFISTQEDFQNDQMGDSQASDEENDPEDDDESEGLNVDRLLEKVLERATEPSPVKAIFSRKELEEAAVALCQHLAGVGRKRNFSGTSNKSDIAVMSDVIAEGKVNLVSCPTDTLFSSHLSKCTKGESEIDSPTHSHGNMNKTAGVHNASSSTVQQLMEMGFSRKVIENAILSIGTFTPSAETLVAWLLENQELVSTPVDYSTQTQSSSADVEISESDSMSEEFEDIDASGHDCCIQPEVFKKKSDFKNIDEYAAYVQDHVSIGMTVMCIIEFDDVLEGDIGKVVKIERDELHDLNVQVLTHSVHNFNQSRSIEIGRSACNILIISG